LLLAMKVQEAEHIHYALDKWLMWATVN
jgi:hypothetical protein